MGEHRGQLARWYREQLKSVEGIQCIEQGKYDAPWVFGVEAKNREARDLLRDHLAAAGVETRNYFFALHLEPVNFYGGDAGVYDISLPSAESLAQVGFYVPTHSFLEHGDVVYICGIIRRFFDSSHAAPVPPRKKGWANIERSKCLSGSSEPL